MSDQPNPQHHSLAEISHLFLSSVRERTTGNSPAPQRTPPKRAAVSIDLTPEEFAQVAGDADEQDEHEGRATVGATTAILGAHLNGKQSDRAREYARHLAADGVRVGLIEVDPSEFRVTCFGQSDGADAPADEPAVECFDPRRMNEVLEELSWDVQRWLLVLPQTRVPEARQLLRNVRHWLLLSTCDHDGVIACYRTVKGLADLWPDDGAREQPRVSLALLDVLEQEQADKVSAKLVSVCQQFLKLEIQTEPPVLPAGQDVREHLVINCSAARDKGQLAAAPQWQIMRDFIERSNQQPAVAQTVEQSVSMPQADVEDMPRNITLSTDTADVIDLPMPDTGESGIVDAVLRHSANELVECPIAPPMCPRARLAVSRDRRIVMLAVSRQGLADLNTIGQAYRWLQENQNLIGMAVPQLSIDTQQQPHLSLLVNQSDSNAQTLGPMFEGGNVTIKIYRKLRWGGKTGLLLEAA